MDKPGRKKQKPSAVEPVPAPDAAPAQMDESEDMEDIIRQRREKRPRAAQYDGSYAGMDKPGRKKQKPSAAEPSAVEPEEPSPAAQMDDIEELVQQRREKRPRAAQYQGSYAGTDKPGKRKKGDDAAPVAGTIQLAEESASAPRRSARLAEGAPPRKTRAKKRK